MARKSPPAPKLGHPKGAGRTHRVEADRHARVGVPDQLGQRMKERRHPRSGRPKQVAMVQPEPVMARVSAAGARRDAARGCRAASTRRRQAGCGGSASDPAPCRQDRRQSSRRRRSPGAHARPSASRAPPGRTNGSVWQEAPWSTARTMSMREMSVPKSLDAQRTKAKTLFGAKRRTRRRRSIIVSPVSWPKRIQRSMPPSTQVSSTRVSMGPTSRAGAHAAFGSGLIKGPPFVSGRLRC